MLKTGTDFINFLLLKKLGNKKLFGNTSRYFSVRISTSLISSKDTGENN